MKVNIVFAIVFLSSLAVPAQEKVPIKFDLPKPRFAGTPRAINPKTVNLEPYPLNKPQPQILAVPVGSDKLLSRSCKVTASDDDPIIGELHYVTDGDKTLDASTYLELMPGLQWIQIDLGGEKEIHAICIWRIVDDGWGMAFSDEYLVGRVYRDVIIQISNYSKFAEGVVTIFNNDHDNSAGLGKGRDKEYIESIYGKAFAVDAVKGRYVRCYSRGNTANEMNHYTEVEVYGRSIERKQQAEADNAEVRKKKQEAQ